METSIRNKQDADINIRQCTGDRSNGWGSPMGRIQKNLSPKELLDGANNFYLDVSVKKTWLKPRTSLKYKNWS